jgi:formamidopyrimidine-DNA glycosylase
MPELPEVEAWVRELDPLVARAPIEDARPGHVATLKSFDPPQSALQGRTLVGARRRGKNLLFPTTDGELVLRVHLMSAGRLRYVPAGKKGPAKPMFRVGFADGGELVLTEAGKKKRAGVWLLSPAQLDAELAHLGPDALDVDTATLAAVLGRERRQLHPLLRDQRALAGIGRAHANEILWEARLSPFRLSTDLDDEVEMRSRCDPRRPPAPSSLSAGKGDAHGVTHPRAFRRAPPTLRRDAPPRGLRGAHDHVLPRLPDGRPHPRDRCLHAFSLTRRARASLRPGAARGVGPEVA